MAKMIEFNVEVRERTGSGGSRETRRQGLIPAVLYGGGQDPVAIAIPKREVEKAVQTGQFKSSTATLVYKGKKQLVLPQDIQMHPVSDLPIHVDLFRVTDDQIIKVEVIVHFIGEEISPGLKKGGTVNVVRHTVELNVPAGSIPDYLEADLSALEVGDNLKISDINLPKNASPTITDRDFTIATIAGRGGAVETDTEETTEEAPEAASEA